MLWLESHYAINWIIYFYNTAFYSFSCSGLGGHDGGEGCKEANGTDLGWRRSITRFPLHAHTFCFNSSLPPPCPTRTPCSPVKLSPQKMKHWIMELPHVGQTKYFWIKLNDPSWIYERAILSQTLSLTGNTEELLRDGMECSRLYRVCRSYHESIGNTTLKWTVSSVNCHTTLPYPKPTIQLKLGKISPSTFNNLRFRKIRKVIFRALPSGTPPTWTIIE